MQVGDLEGRILTMDFHSLSPVSTSSDGSEAIGPRVPEAGDKVSGSVLRHPMPVTSCLEGRCKR